jgi:hypothetical protein
MNAAKQQQVIPFCLLQGQFSSVVFKSELTELSKTSMALGLLSLFCYPSLRSSRGAPDGRTHTHTHTHRNLQLYESPDLLVFTG